MDVGWQNKIINLRVGQLCVQLEYICLKFEMRAVPFQNVSQLRLSQSQCLSLCYHDVSNIPPEQQQQLISWTAQTLQRSHKNLDHWLSLFILTPGAGSGRDHPWLLRRRFIGPTRQTNGLPTPEINNAGHRSGGRWGSVRRRLVGRPAEVTLNMK